MSDEPTERDRALARAVVNSDWFAEQLAQARREGAAEVTARVEALAEMWDEVEEPWEPGRDEARQLRAALRGDA